MIGTLGQKSFVFSSSFAQLEIPSRTVSKREETQWAMIWTVIDTELPQLRLALESATSEVPQIWTEQVPR
jgi:hypothetical protein